MLRSLLQRVPPDERTEAIRAAVDSVGSGGTADIGLTVSLLPELLDDDLKQRLRARLLRLLEGGQTDLVRAVYVHDALLQRDLLREVAHRLDGFVGQLQQHAPTDGAEIIAKFVPSRASALSPQDGEIGPCEDSTDIIVHLLTFVKSADLPGAEIETFDRLFKATLLLLEHTSGTLSVGARETLVSLFGAGPRMSGAHHQLVWACLQRLVAQEHSRGLAYAIWLRWVFCENAWLHFFFERPYWHLLRQGLQHGDGERRKQCLAILRQSVAIVVSDESSIATITSREGGTTGRSIEAQAPQDRTGLIAQYDRFCTVFETIVLGRYLNQVIECEDDLRLLASPGSALQAEWLFTLLASALHPKLQDSNRKFIGNWIMRSRFQPDTSEAFTSFFRSPFLPWATQGSLFTSSLRMEGGHLRCKHGDRLVEYIQHVLQLNSSNPAITSSLINVLLDLLAARRSFAYADVYILEGLARAFYISPTIVLGAGELGKLASLTSWAALPEVARDQVFLRCSKLCRDNASRAAESVQSEVVAKAITRWNGVEAMLKGGAGEGLQVGAVATWHSERSNRDVREDAAIELCHVLRRDPEQSLDPRDAETKLLEIWTDLEYLEYPKKLLMLFPSILLHPRLVMKTLDCEELGKSVVDMVHKLQLVSGTRTYLISPLVRAVRLAVMAVPASAAVLKAEDFIVGYAEHLPEHTVDLRLEDATSHVLQSIAPAFKVLSYEHYFGPRGTLGAAALLDMTSRLGSNDSDMVVSLLDNLLEPWTSQIVPPLTVSPWKSTLQLQLALLCCEQVPSSFFIASLLKQLHYILSLEPLPRFRYLLTWMIVRIYVKHESLRASLLCQLVTKDHHSNPKYVASLMKIAVMLANTENADANFGSKLAAAMIPLAASSKIIIRHEAQWQFPMLMNVARSRSWHTITDNVAFTALDDYIRSLDLFEQPPRERLLDRFDPVKDHTMTNLVEGPWYGLDNTEEPICRREDFVDLYRRVADAGDSLPPTCMPLGKPLAPLPSTAASSEPPLLVDDPQHPLPASQPNNSRALQTKSSASTTPAQIPIPHLHPPPNNLIIIASLVENPHNLGGLSRISEALGASSLHLANPHIVTTKAFLSLSVTSHLHLPILPLPIPALPSYLAAKRSEGFTIVGLEQTDRSLVLGSEGCKMPERVVLVLGSERAGIPARVLAECGVLVEIEQRGVTRSLNVQTAAGVVLFEYMRQHGVGGEVRGGCVCWRWSGGVWFVGRLRACSRNRAYCSYQEGHS
ncbi:hypothetical protein LTR02_016521 [Friedmanniomyces endolithicus]|nr:hypothetical protein LTR94_021840 [Friedmanniomyces endolithicus]KAK0769033.1 hypothetical protein LTR59_017266 [Friedmanniomyces endolithicus]KAK0792896.1 hypothetical protein LTR38_009757 [Friedmanniomyces endolithicus]KAK0854077.1 hypothetical protein LTS02_011690 [Friedmanniomyces endolithicus]KAK0872136.1 hypothetical protein LTR87_012532 [Friedmanniomyces endolithicus]